MKRFSTITPDDANDTLLFKKLEKNALKRLPNPERIGCPDDEILKRFVDKPNEVTVGELNGWHIYGCRECTLQLKELRALREERLRQTGPRPNRSRMTGLVPVLGVASLCVLFLIGALAWRNYTNRAVSSPPNARIVMATIDLSQDGTLRGKSSDDTVPHLSLPKQLVDLDLILPYFSPAGEYRVAVTTDKSSDATEVEQQAPAIANGASSEIRVILDLRRLASGEYNLRTIRTVDGSARYYPLNIH